jgi:hypothetical protein
MLRALTLVYCRRPSLAPFSSFLGRSPREIRNRGLPPIPAFRFEPDFLILPPTPIISL